MTKPIRKLEMEVGEDYCTGRFKAMASPCEVLVNSRDQKLAKRLSQLVADEAWRIEDKFSRYRDDNIVYKINHAQGAAVQVDEETAGLLNFADHAYAISDGKFDLSSGVLRRVWKFDGSDNIPSRQQAQQLLATIGWDKIQWRDNRIQLRSDMEIDFGGIGKEYAVDRAAAIVKAETNTPVLINFGGDLFATAPPSGQHYWHIGVEKVAGMQSALVQLKHGGLATSGDANRFLQKDGLRYPHVLDPHTAWPVMDAPRSVTVAADSCIEAGLIATLAMLNGAEAEAFLEAQDVLFWLQN
ncbi:MAG: FAD:protein FMN transferase [Spongiibacteraceae bacterium]